MCRYTDPTKDLHGHCSLGMYWEYDWDVIAFVETADRFDPNAVASDPNRYDVVMDGCQSDGTTGSTWGRLVNGDIEPHAYSIRVEAVWVRPGYTSYPAASAFITVSAPLGQTVNWSSWLTGSGFAFGETPGPRTIDCRLAHHEPTVTLLQIAAECRGSCSP